MPAWRPGKGKHRRFLPVQGAGGFRPKTGVNVEVERNRMPRTEDEWLELAAEVFEREDPQHRHPLILRCSGCGNGFLSLDTPEVIREAVIGEIGQPALLDLGCRERVQKDRKYFQEIIAKLRGSGVRY